MNWKDLVDGRIVHIDDTATNYIVIILEFPSGELQKIGIETVKTHSGIFGFELLQVK